MSYVKTCRYGTIVFKVPLTEIAKQLLREAVDTHGAENEILFGLSAAYANRILKTISQEAVLAKPLHFHVGRSTFASLYDQAGGNHRALMELIGNSTINTLMTHVQTNSEVIAKAVEKMNISNSKLTIEPPNCSLFTN